MSLLPLFQWLAATSVGGAIRNSLILHPLVEIVHLMGMAMVVGTILVIDLGLLGIAMRRQPVWRIARDLAPVTWAGLGVMLITGLLLLTSEALRCYDNPIFWLKMGLLVTALVFHVTIHRMATSQDTSVAPVLAKLVACLSLTLWFGIGFAGKGIGFY